MGEHFSHKHNCILFENISDPNQDTFKIFISGGSTSDLIFQKYNWPKLLNHKLQEKNINYQIYVGAAVGYNTKQELYKLQRDGLNINGLNLHISYFGANELSTTQTLNNDIENGSITFAPYPNLMWSLGLYKFFGVNDFTILRNSLLGNETIKMLKLMYATSIVNQHTFLPILQPLAGVGSLENINGKDFNLNHNDTRTVDSLAQQHNNLYNEFIQRSNELDFQIHDFTNIFQDTDDIPLLDNCHIKEEYQTVIADKILHLITEHFQQVKF